MPDQGDGDIKPLLIGFIDKLEEISKMNDKPQQLMCLVELLDIETEIK